VVARLPDIFLSYSREDQATVRRYAEALEREGFKVWWDSALNPGETFDQVTEQALKEAKAVVVLWSKTSVTSRWVRSEATQADRFGTLVPVTIEPCDRPIMFELTHTMDLSGWSGDRNQTEWRAFVTGLERQVEKGGTSNASVPAATPAPVQNTRTALAWAAAALIAIGAGLYWNFHSREAKTATTTAGSPAAGSRAASAPAPLASIAVLPFRDMSQNKDQEYFADGVTEEILNTLAGLKDLKVTARTSAFAFKGKDVDLRTVGETLGVQHILEGSIRKDGETLRITAQLIDTKSDAHVWSRTYERPLKDIFKIQDEIARSVAEALQVSLGVGFGNQPGMTRDVEAYDAYLAGVPLKLQFTPETQRRAIGLLEQAIARDPNYGDAWLNLADAYGGMIALVTGDAQVWRQKSDAALDNARRLAPTHPGVHYLLAARSINRLRWTEAAGHIEDLAAVVSKRGALEGVPRGAFFVRVGRTREALPMLEQAKARDPLSPEVSFFLGIVYSSVRNFPASVAEFKRGYALGPSMQYLFQIGALSNALASRDHSEILRLLETPISASPATQVADFDKSLLDRPADALAKLRNQVRDPSATAVQLLGFSNWLAYFGDTRTALEALRLSFERGAVDAASATTWYPVMREVRKLPEFKQLVRDMGFVDYWKQYGWGDYCKPTAGDDFECI
jgi:TolB-like protein/tetratricopeptide (TPR) repeat protein